MKKIKSALNLVSIAEAILWGEQLRYIKPTKHKVMVSIAEAILWGEQRQNV